MAGVRDNPLRVPGNGHGGVGMRGFLGRSPNLFRLLYGLKGEERVVGKDTRIVIEGFPRSANTFAVLAFEQAQPRKVRIAHHIHSPAQVLLASRWKIPTMVLIRRPQDAVASWVIWDGHDIAWALRYYTYFYSTVAYCKNDYLLAPFEEVTEDYGAVIRRMNEKFGTDFHPFEHTPENVREVYSRIEDLHRRRNGGNVYEVKLARPTKAKDLPKREVLRWLRAPRYGRLLSEATAVYEDLLGSRKI